MDFKESRRDKDFVTAQLDFTKLDRIPSQVLCRSTRASQDARLAEGG